MITNSVSWCYFAECIFAIVMFKYEVTIADEKSLEPKQTESKAK